MRTWSPELRNASIAAVLMAAAAALAMAITPRERLVDVHGAINLERSVPIAFADWTLDPALNNAVVNPERQAFVERIYGQTLGRVYVNAKGERIMLSIAYGEDQRRESSLHLPEVCYPAQGFSIKGRSQVQLQLASGALGLRRLETAQGAERPEPLSYWVVIGEKRVESGLARKLALLRYGLQGQIADGLIIRVSSIGSDSRAQFALQDRFIADLVAAFPSDQRRRFVGAFPNWRMANLREQTLKR